MNWGNKNPADEAFPHLRDVALLIQDNLSVEERLKKQLLEGNEELKETEGVVTLRQQQQRVEQAQAEKMAK